MQENNFEGKMNELMEGFKINPSEEVWGKIQADIRGNKKDRFGVLPVALLTTFFLLTTFLLHDLKRKEPGTLQSNFSKINKEPASILDKNLASSKIVNRFKKNRIPTVFDRQFNSSNLNSKKKILAAEKNVINNIPIEESGDETKVKVDNTSVAENKDEEKIKDKDKAKNEAAIVTIIDNKIDSVQEMVSAKQLIKKDAIVQEEKKELQHTNKEIVKKVNKNKWQFFAAVSGGKFYTGNNYLGHIPNLAYYSYADAATGNGVPSNSFFQPSQIKAGASLSASINAHKKLFGKTFLSLGIGYQYAGTYITIGQVLTGTQNGSFASGTSNEFHNTYHFIQLPVQIQSNIGKGNKLPLYWNAGFTVSRLVNANVLQFDRTQGRYFKDNNYLTKNIVGISGGLSLAILKGQKIEWLIGPQFYYSLSSLATKGLYDKAHYSFIGLQLQKKL